MLGLILAQPAEAVALGPRLRLLCRDSSSKVVFGAAAALAQTGATDDEALRMSRARLGGGAQEDGQEFAEAFGRLAGSSEKARALLVSALGSEHSAVELALEAVRWLGSEDAGVQRALVRLCESEDSDVKTEAMRALKDLRKARVSLPPRSLPAP